MLAPNRKCNEKQKKIIEKNRECKGSRLKMYENVCKAGESIPTFKDVQNMNYKQKQKNLKESLEECYKILEKNGKNSTLYIFYREINK